MDNRFGFKDLILVVLLLVLIVSVWLAMKQYDRQWSMLAGINDTLQDQNDQLKELGQRLAQGVAVRPGSNGNSANSQNGKPSRNLAAVFDRIAAAAEMSDFSPGDWHVQAVGATIGKLTPLTSSDVYQSMVAGYVLESLATRDPATLEWKPVIARSWQISDDGLTIHFQMRGDVRFSDGRPLTARDIVFSYEWIMNPKVAAPRDRAYYSKIQSVTADGDHRVTFKLAEPYFKGFEICAGLSILAEHYYGQFTEAQFNEEPGLLFGSGPYRLSVDPVEWKPGSGKVELLRNDRYWGLAPAFARIVFREITDETARLVAFRNGEIDVFNPRPEQYIGLKNDKPLLEEKDLYEYETITGGYRYVAWNQSRNDKPTLFADRRVRRAMTLLTDRQEMTRALMVGLATVNSGPFHRLSKQANAEVEPWPYDPKGARTLLAEAGFKDRDADGVIENAQGEPFEFKLIYPSGIINYQQMVLHLKDAYARAGIVLEPDPLEWTIMLQRIGQRDYDAMTLGWSGSIESDPFQIFHSAQISEGGDNYVHYRNERLDELIDKARVTMDEAARLKLWHEVHAILHEDQPYTFLWTQRAVVFVDKRIRNVQRVKLGLNPQTEWFVPMSLQKWR
jgi:peptide/nickel transport system substrate-binding protein